ncbi:hypothetical protein NKJ88_15305 [Mesorhizobium sp. M0016]|uniref:hypothetical protein n=1 Tax=Mesorhizobium sp. M0016 TaxID=2956843 RepID=UPI00333BFC4C
MPCQSLSWNSGTPTYRRSSPIAQRGFCPECGSPLSLCYDASPTEIALHVGTGSPGASVQLRFSAAPWLGVLRNRPTGPRHRGALVAPRTTQIADQECGPCRRAPKVRSRSARPADVARPSTIPKR